MDKPYAHEQLLHEASLTPEDLQIIKQRRRPKNRLGFASQLAFVRLYDRFPVQSPSFEVDADLLTFVGIQLDPDVQLIEAYTSRQPTISEHQERIRQYCRLVRFEEGGTEPLQISRCVRCYVGGQRTIPHSSGTTINSSSWFRFSLVSRFKMRRNIAHEPLNRRRNVGNVREIS